MTKKALLKFLRKYPDDTELGFAYSMGNGDYEWEPLELTMPTPKVFLEKKFNSEDLNGKRWVIFNSGHGYRLENLTTEEVYERKEKFKKFIGNAFEGTKLYYDFGYSSVGYPCVKTKIAGDEIPFSLTIRDNKYSFRTGDMPEEVAFKNGKAMRDFFLERRKQLIEWRKKALEDA